MIVVVAIVTLTPVNQDSALFAQGRVRRLIGRRRAGLDRYVGALSREMGQESVDPISDMLSQLTGKVMSAFRSLLFITLPAFLVQPS